MISMIKSKLFNYQLRNNIEPNAPFFMIFQFLPNYDRAKKKGNEFLYPICSLSGNYVQRRRDSRPE